AEPAMRGGARDRLVRSITTCVPAMASLRPSPVMVLTPVLGEAATTSWACWRRMGMVFEPIKPEPPITTIFIANHLVRSPQPGVCDGPAASCRQRVWSTARETESLHFDAHLAGAGLRDLALHLLEPPAGVVHLHRRHQSHVSFRPTGAACVAPVTITQHESDAGASQKPMARPPL